MQHQLTNQELARLRYADALRNGTRRVALVDDVEVSKPRRPALPRRTRIAIGNLFAHSPLRGRPSGA